MADANHVTELLPAYALECVSDDEAAQVAAHLAMCPSCSAELRAYLGIADLLALGAPDAAPPPAVKARLLARVRSQEVGLTEADCAPWRRHLPSLMPPGRSFTRLAVLLLILVLFAGNALLWLQLRALQEAPPTQLRVVVLSGTDAAPGALGRIVLDLNALNAVLTVEGLQPLDETRQYQLWLIHPDGRRSSGALFSVDSTGAGSTLVEAPQPFLDFVAVGVTVEPAGGSPGPTGTRVLAGEL